MARYYGGGGGGGGGGICSTTNPFDESVLQLRQLRFELPILRNGSTQRCLVALHRIQERILNDLVVVQPLHCQI